MSSRELIDRCGRKPKADKCFYDNLLEGFLVEFFKQKTPAFNALTKGYGELLTPFPALAGRDFVHLHSYANNRDFNDNDFCNIMNRSIKPIASLMMNKFMKEMAGYNMVLFRGLPFPKYCTYATNKKMFCVEARLIVFSDFDYSTDNILTQIRIDIAFVPLKIMER